jgi:hypothetical protein
MKMSNGFQAAPSEVCAGCGAALAVGCKECGLCSECCRGHELPGLCQGCEAEQKKMLAVTHGKSGVTELPAVAEPEKRYPEVGDRVEVSVNGKWFKETVVAIECEEVAGRVVVTSDSRTRASVKREGISWRWPQPCQQYDCTEAPAPGGAGFCGSHAVELGIMKLPGPRTCRGIPIYQSPEESCDCVLGREVKSDRCAVCEEWMRVHGECDGCVGRLPGWTVTGKLCADCRAVRQAAIRERMADAASGRAEWMVFPPSGDIGAIGIRRDGATFTLAIYDRTGLFEMKPIITSTFGPETTVLEWFREVLR